MTKYFGFEHEDGMYTSYSDDSRILDIYEYGASVEYDENHALCMLMRDDESISAWALPYKNVDELNDALHDEADEIAGYLYKHGIAEDESKVLGISYLYELDDFGNPDDPASLANQVYVDLTLTVENSYVDGDSGFVLAIIDLVNNEVIASGDHEFNYLDSKYINEMMADLED